MFWDLIQQCQIGQRRNETLDLSARVRGIENELAATRQLVHDLMIRLEERLGQDLNKDGRVG
jgi:hypothetical protein